MALIECPECHKQVSDKAQACVSCGYPLNLAPSNLDSGHSILTADREDRDEIEKNRVAAGEGSHPSTIRQQKRHIRGWAIFALFCIGVVALWEHLSVEKEPAPTESAIVLINGEGNTVSCPPKILDDCVRDAESKGFVKLSDAVAGISVDWNAKPLRVVGVRGTAAEAGIRNGDILLELDDRKISEPRSVSIIMSIKHPGDELKVKVMRTGSPMDFAYKVMARSTQLGPVVTQESQGEPSQGSADSEPPPPPPYHTER